jgi:hypothetical protein
MLIDQALAWFLCCYPSPISSDRLVNPAWEFVFGYILGLASSHELDL